MSLILNGTDGLSDVDGSAATPAIRGTDANTGIFFPAADTVAISEGGVESVRFDSNGNSLFGTTTNTNNSRVVSNGVVESTTGGFRFPDGTTQTTAAGAGPISLFTGTGTVGDVAVLIYTQNSALSSGSTVSGSFLFRITSYTSPGIINGQGPGMVFAIGGDFRNRTTDFNFNATNFSPQSGTWRLLNATTVKFQADSYGSVTFLSAALAIRIS
jgi:hypothetical protein